MFIMVKISVIMSVGARQFGTGHVNCTLVGER